MVDSDRNSPAVVDDSDGIVRIDRDDDRITEPRQCFIHGIIYDLIYQMVQTSGRSGSYIHTGSLADRLQPFQNLNLIRSVFYAHTVPPFWPALTVPFTTRNTRLISNLLRTKSSSPVQVIIVLNISNAVEQIILTIAVQLGQYIVQQQDRRILRHPFHQLDFRKFQGKRGRPLLP